MLHATQTGRTDCSVGSSHGNPECPVPMAQQCNCSAERRHRGRFPSVAEEVGVVGTPSL